MWAVLGLQTAILPMLFKHLCQTDRVLPETGVSMTVEGGRNKKPKVGSMTGVASWVKDEDQAA